jgi:hypothetical protein
MVVHLLHTPTRGGRMDLSSYFVYSPADKPDVNNLVLSRDGRIRGVEYLVDFSDEAGNTWKKGCTIYFKDDGSYDYVGFPKAGQCVLGVMLKARVHFYPSGRVKEGTSACDQVVNGISIRDEQTVLFEEDGTLNRRWHNDRAADV